MAAVKLADFDQGRFMATWTYRDGEMERNAVIRSGACTVFSLVFVKLASLGKSLEEIGVLFRQNLEAIVRSQANGQKAHLARGDGYDAVLKDVALNRSGDFVQASAMSHTIASGDAWIHVFDTSFAFGPVQATAHTIAHLRMGDDVYTFDPNFGLWRVPSGEWNEWLLTHLTRSYNIATNSRFLKITK